MLGVELSLQGSEFCLMALVSLAEVLACLAKQLLLLVQHHLLLLKPGLMGGNTKSIHRAKKR